MGCCQARERRRDEAYAKLMASKYTKYSEAGGEKIKTRGPRMKRSSTRVDTFLVHIGLVGDIEMYEKRCWLLRLLDGDEFDIDKHTQIEVLNNNHMSQCNKNFTINNGHYCAQISIINQTFFENDASPKKINFDEYNAFVLCYDVTKIESFNKVKMYLDKIKHSNICIMGIVPSCNDNEEHKQVETNLAKELCTNCIQFIGETNAKTGENVYESMQTTIQKCIETQQMPHEKDFIAIH